MILIKTPEEIALMREGGRHHASILRELRALVVPGTTTLGRDQKAEELVRAYGDIPAFKGYQPDGAPRPYPATLCTSVNQVVVHGIPSASQVLREGDVVSLDLGVQHGGMFTDAAITVPVGKVLPEIANNGRGPICLAITRTFDLRYPTLQQIADTHHHWRDQTED